MNISEPDHNFGVPHFSRFSRSGALRESITVLKVNVLERVTFTRCEIQYRVGFGKSPMSQTPRDMGTPIFLIP